MKPLALKKRQSSALCRSSAIDFKKFRLEKNQQINPVKIRVQSNSPRKQLVKIENSESFQCYTFVDQADGHYNVTTLSLKELHYDDWSHYRKTSTISGNEVSVTIFCLIQL